MGSRFPFTKPNKKKKAPKKKKKAQTLDPLPPHKHQKKNSSYSESLDMIISVRLRFFF